MDSNLVRVLDRASKMYPNYKRATMVLDLHYANEDTPLDFDRLLGFPDFDFAHDIAGIHNNMNRETCKLENCFLPRCAKTGA